MRGARRNLVKAFRAERQETTATVRMRQPFEHRDRVRYSPANILKGRVIPEHIRLALDISPWAPRLTNAITRLFLPASARPAQAVPGHAHHARLLGRGTDQDRRQDADGRVGPAEPADPHYDQARLLRWTPPTPPLPPLPPRAARGDSVGRHDCGVPAAAAAPLRCLP